MIFDFRFSISDCSDAESSRCADSPQSKIKNQKSKIAPLLLALLTLAPIPALADRVQINGISYPEVRVTGLQDGILIFETSTGREQTAPLLNVDAIHLDAYPALQAADEAMRKGEHAVAANLYKELLAKVDRAYLKVLVGGKLVAALDRSRQSADAVEQYLKLVRLDYSRFTEAAMPQNPPSDPQQRQALAEMVDERANVTTNPTARALLQRLADRLRPPSAAPSETQGQAGANPDAAAGAMQAQREAGANGGGGALFGGESEPASDPITEMIEAEEYEQALTAVERAIQKNDGSLSRRLYQRGLAQAGLGRDRDAALSFMRIAVHYRPGATRVYLPSLIEAGKAFRRLNRPDHARRLLQEAKGLVVGDPERADEINGLLDALSPAGENGE